MQNANPHRTTNDIPRPSADAGRRALAVILQQRSILPALTVFHEELGDVFQIGLGAFQPVFMVGPDAARFVLVTAREQLLWRPEQDPVTKLLRQGLLVTDGDTHDDLRGQINPYLSRSSMERYVESMWRSTDRILLDWSIAPGPVDMLVDMRRVALLIVMQTLFGVDMLPDMARIFPAMLDVLNYISPGLWTVWPKAPRFGYRRSQEIIDAYLYKVIEQRRREGAQGDDLLSHYVGSTDMSDELIRDQMLTLLIAGHDTSTALLAWTLYLLGKHPSVAELVQEEVDSVLGTEPPSLESVGQLKYMDQVLNESLRLYPPIHIGNRMAATDIEYDGYTIRQGTRVVYSIYLTHRHKAYWPEPDQFRPERFTREASRNQAPYSFLPFGGGRRNCIGAAFAQIEAKVVLSRLLQQYRLTLKDRPIHVHMGATLEPRPGVVMDVVRR